MDGPAALGTVSVAAHVGLDRVAENRPLLNTVKAALKEEGHKVSANALGRGAKFAGKIAFVAHIGFATYEGWEDYQTCAH
ncbi:MAG: hypothetical protein DMG39_06975 [Acidobacteria bacterium]|nr:MAG: hypothetical protein DMG39_06975 [Acidobacteriota bacterium]